MGKATALVDGTEDQDQVDEDDGQGMESAVGGTSEGLEDIVDSSDASREETVAMSPSLEEQHAGEGWTYHTQTNSQDDLVLIQ